MELRQTPPFHTFFLPKRERKYQRKRFRAAARTPRGHRSCSALSALEMRRRLQRCYCIPQNEALAPLMWRKTYVFGCSHGVHPKTPEGTWFERTHTLHPYQKAYSIKMSASFTTLFFTFFYFEEIKERISQGCEGFSPRKLRRLRWFLRKLSFITVYQAVPQRVAVEFG